MYIGNKNKEKGDTLEQWVIDVANKIGIELLHISGSDSNDYTIPHPNNPNRTYKLDAVYGNTYFEITKGVKDAKESKVEITSGLLKEHLPNSKYVLFIENVPDARKSDGSSSYIDHCKLLPQIDEVVVGKKNIINYLVNLPKLNEVFYLKKEIKSNSNKNSKLKVMSNSNVNVVNSNYDFVSYFFDNGDMDRARKAMGMEVTSKPKSKSSSNTEKSAYVLETEKRKELFFKNTNATQVESRPVGSVRLSDWIENNLNRFNLKFTINQIKKGIWGADVDSIKSLYEPLNLKVFYTQKGRTDIYVVDNA